MAASGHFENYIFHNLTHSDVWFMTYRVFWAKKLICDISFIIWPCLDLQIQYGTRRPSWKLHFQYAILWSPVVPSAVWLMLCGVFGGKKIIFDVRLLIRLDLDLQMQVDHHVANGLCKPNWGWMFHKSEMELAIRDVVCSCTVVVQCVIIRWEADCTLIF